MSAKKAIVILIDGLSLCQFNKVITALKRGLQMYQH